MNLKKYLLHIYFKTRNARPIWKLINKKAIDLLSKNRPSLDSEQKRIVDEMKKTGIAVSTLDILFPGQNMLQILSDYSKTLHPEEAEQGKKLYLKKYWDRFPIFNLSNPFLRLTLEKKILDIVNEYMGMWSILKQYDLAMTIPVSSGTDAVQSQRWHRDPQEKKIFKMFIYLNDVGDDAGPFFYIVQSNHEGIYGKLFPQKTPEGIYMKEEELKEKIPTENIKKMTGKAGTVIFCDTSGIHKGGYATKNERLMFTSFFSSTSYIENTTYSFPKDFKITDTPLSKEAQFAISQGRYIS
ncbi:MAG: phytanoyl-CoA dioxygenase family protein [Candidatus Paceibacterota bacterium]